MYFTPHEFRCRCGVCGLNGSQISPALIDKLEILRADFGKPMVITSALRCESWNKKVLGKPDSYHLVRRGGCAVDVSVTNGEDRAKLAYLAMGMGLSVGVAHNFLHLDSRPTQVLFTY